MYKEDKWFFIVIDIFIYPDFFQEQVLKILVIVYIHILIFSVLFAS